MNKNIRLCIACGQMKDKKELCRIVKSGDGEISLDKTGRKNGRGAYICRDKSCMEKLAKSRGLERSFKMSVAKEVYDNLILEMDELLDE